MINDLINRIKKNEFLRNSIVLFTASMFMNLFGYLFHFYVGRKLGPVDYGVFGALSSILYLLIVPLTTIQTTITKFVSTFKVANEYGKIKYLFTRSLNRLLIVGVILAIIFMIFSKLIAAFLHLDSIFPLFLLSVFFIFSLLLPVNRGVLQGVQNFYGLGLNFINEGLFKFLFGILLVGFGFKVNGAITALILSYLIPFLLSFYSLKFLFKTEKIKFETKNIYAYSLPVLFTTLLLTAFYSLDVILVKHFLNAQEAGYYVAASLLAKIVYFASGAITLVLFPQVNELYLKKLAHKKILFRAMIIVFLVTGLITLFYFLFPSFTVNLLFGSKYIIIKNYIGLFALAMTVFSLIYILSFYNLSINKTNFVYLLLLFIILEIALIYLYHNSILQIIYILLILLSFLFLSLLVYTLI